MCSELHVPEKRFALLLGMKLVQRHKFMEAIKVLRRQEDYHLLRKLATMIDENKLVAGGRLSELMAMKHYIEPDRPFFRSVPWCSRVPTLWISQMSELGRKDEMIEFRNLLRRLALRTLRCA